MFTALLTGKTPMAFKAIAATGVIIPAVLAIAAPAHTTAVSPTGPISCITTPDGGAAACFQTSGDHIYVYDTKADGHHAVAVWRTSYGRTGTCTNMNSNGNTYDTEKNCNYDLNEGETIEFRADTREGNTLISASGYAIATI
jgi:hypothetical protein